MTRGSIGIAVAVLVALSSFQTATGAQGRGQGATTPPAPQAAQTPTRDNTTQPTTVGTGEITGAVTLEGAGTPVRRAQVSLNAQEIRGQRTLVTDDKGRFSFTSLPAGRYTLSASKPSYVSMTYGAKKAGRQGTPIQLVDGQKFDRASISMPKGSVLTGTVIDENGEPSPGTQVRAFRYVLRTGEKTLQQAGAASTDDRGIYRIYGLQPGDYVVSATPRNMNLGDLRQTVMSQVEQLLQQAQAMNATGAGGQGGTGGGGGGRGGGGAGGGGAGAGRGGGGGAQNLPNLGRAAGGGRGQALIDQANQLQAQLAAQEKEQSVGYAPVYYPGTTIPASATTVALNVGEERAGVDFQLQLVATAIVSGTVVSPDGRVPQGTQITLRAAAAQGVPSVPGQSDLNARVLADGTFAFSNVPPGQYTVAARSMIRAQDPNQTQANAQNPAAAAQQGRGRGAFGGPGGPGGPGMITSILWASADVTVNGQNVTGLGLQLASGMTVSGRVEFHGTTLATPTDLTRVRVTISSSDTQNQDFAGGMPPATVDANGTFTIKGVPPGHYVLRGNAPAGGNGQPGAAGGGGGRGGGGGVQTATTTTSGSWTLKSSAINGRDSLDFPFEVRPGADVANALLSFVDKNQTLKGTISDATGRPTSDYTIIVFAADKTFWTPSSRRITSARPGTDGSYSMRGLPAGDYRITAVVDVEQGEWFDPAFLEQLMSASIPVSIAEGETKTQDVRLAGGGTF
jgi:protocatechuate 3,4-dioxygenase beta subunit